MIINIRTKNISLNNALKTWTEDKISELDKFLGKFQKNDELNFEVEIGKTTKHHKKGDIFRAEIQLFLPKKKLRAVSKNIDLRTAIIEARDQLDREIRKYKGKRLDRARKWARRVKERIRTPKVLKRR